MPRVPSLHFNRHGHVSGLHHHRPHCHKPVFGFGRPHISRHTGLPTGGMHVHRPLFSSWRPSFWSRPVAPVYVAPILTPSIGVTRSISPISAVGMALGITAATAGAVAITAGICSLPFSLAAGLSLALFGSVLFAGGLGVAALSE